MGDDEFEEDDEISMGDAMFVAAAGVKCGGGGGVDDKEVVDSTDGGSL